MGQKGGSLLASTSNASAFVGVPSLKPLWMLKPADNQIHMSGGPILPNMMGAVLWFCPEDVLMDEKAMQSSPSSQNAF